MILGRYTVSRNACLAAASPASTSSLSLSPWPRTSARAAATAASAALSASEMADLLIFSCTGVMRAVSAGTRASKSSLSLVSVVTKLAIDIVTANSASPRQLTAVVMALSYFYTKASVLSVTLRLYSWVLTAAANISNKRPRITLHILCATRRSLNFMIWRNEGKRGTATGRKATGLRNKSDLSFILFKQMIKPMPPSRSEANP